ISIYGFYSTRFGLRLRFAGEHPEALRSAGVPVMAKRWQGVLLSGLLAGIAGGTLSTYLSSSFIRNMSAGRGFIALAAVILGKWRPVQTVLACILFGLTEQIQIRLQGVKLFGSEEPVPVQWIQILPYLITILVLAFAVGRSRAPRALGVVE
ncbi:MAG: ABC transporter permease, partial [Proteobacteria bacterium]|nr:ABC transporter permease [Pseudomonadota bacterium]